MTAMKKSLKRQGVLMGGSTLMRIFRAGLTEMVTCHQLRKTAGTEGVSIVNIGGSVIKQRE